ncbi:MAG: Zn-ribbon domain-containing OB-fold protein [Chloroflexi bacterium]|nr:Zn-ribbon domain-containing OB-fold protein [Chloroflexota bacterium]
MEGTTKPLPKPTPLSEPYWRAAREHRLVAPRCRDCGQLFYPGRLCPRCLGDSFEWPTLSGRGIVYSYTVIRQAAHPAFQPEVPYVFAIIELEEGLRIASNVVGCRPEDVRIGMEVEVVFEGITPDVTLPGFRPVTA